MFCNELSELADNESLPLNAMRGKKIWKRGDLGEIQSSGQVQITNRVLN